MNILLTGGTGYIGSHTAVTLAEAGHHIILYDNLSNSRADVVKHLHTITGQQMAFVQGDIRDADLLARSLRQYAVDAVVHFAGLKAVGESVAQPLAYYANNFCGSLTLLQCMAAANIKTLVFSSSATVYGDPDYLPIDESHPTRVTNPYGRSKLQIEEMLNDLAHAEPDWRIACLRYFNPTGAHQSGLIGENPNDIPNNLMPFIARVAAGKLRYLSVFGDDYATSDGTGVRDYIHVEDLAHGHLAALAALWQRAGGVLTCNLGTGNGHSVLEMIHAFETASGVAVPYRIAPRRPGDIAACYACADKAASELGWRAQLDIQQMCASNWKFQQNCSVD